jgi:hypothetical protein
MKDGLRAGTGWNTGLTAKGPTDLAIIDRIELREAESADKPRRTGSVA